MLKFDTNSQKKNASENSEIPEFEAANFLDSINYHSHNFLGSHQGSNLVKFSLFAPEAYAVSLVGDFCNWNVNSFPMQKQENGFWIIQMPSLQNASRYQFALHDEHGQVEYITDPYSFALSFNERLCSVFYERTDYKWSDHEWIQGRESTELSIKAISILSCDLQKQYLHKTYQELAKQLVGDAHRLNATHIELRSFFEQLTEYDEHGEAHSQPFLFSPKMTMGTPDDFKCFVDYCHSNSIGVILNLGDFIISALRNPNDNPRKNYFLSCLVYWLEDFHVDAFVFEGLGDINFRISDSKKIDFIQNLNESLHARSKGVFTIVADQSTLPYFTKPTYKNGLGFNMKVFEAFSNDILKFFNDEKPDTNLLSFLSIDLFSENHILQLGKQFKILRPDELNLVLAFYFLFPGKKIFTEALDDINADLCEQLAQLSELYFKEELLHESDFKDSCFEWINFDNEKLSFIRWSKTYDDFIQLVFNFSKEKVASHTMGVPKPGLYRTIYTSDPEKDLTGYYSSEKTADSRPNSIVIDLEPLSVQIFKYSHMSS